MRWISYVVIFIIGMAGSIFLYRVFMKPQVPVETRLNSNLKATATPSVKETSLSATRLQTFFVPYWQLDGSNIAFPEVEWAGDAEMRAVYFGVAVSTDGIQEDEAGYQNISLFLEKLPTGIDKYLAVRMTNHSENLDILENPEAPKRIIAETVSLAVDRGFSGIVVDLEFTPTLNSNLPAQINSFVESFKQAAHEQNLTLAMTMYGDTFYRKRPYDIAYLSKVVDEMMIMAYDLHKVNGKPGPNFPLRGRKEYGYDMEALVADFAGVPSEKLTVIFGMYGYDWTVDEKKRPVRPAKSATLAQIQANYIEKCASLNCVRTRQKESAETEIEFVDDKSLYHSVWFEDLESTKQKSDYLKSQGIGSFAFWAYGYF